MSTLIRTDQVPAADRLDFVRRLTAATWVPMECRSEYRADYWAEFRASGLGSMQVVVLDVMPITVRRTPALISGADPDMLKLFLVCDGGSSVVDQGGRQARLAAAEFAFYDTRRPYEVACGVDRTAPTRVMTFMFAPSLLPLARRQIKELAATRIPATAGLGDLTSHFLLQLARNIDHDSPAEAARLSAAALELRNWSVRTAPWSVSNATPPPSPWRAGTPRRPTSSTGSVTSRRWTASRTVSTPWWGGWS